jgi:hypothetical protein
MNVNRHFLIWLLFFSSTVYGTAQESTVLNFDNTFILKFSLRYNFLQLSLDGSPNDKITSNRPMDLEIGFGYKDLFLGVSINIPFLYDTDILRSLSFDFGFNYFYKNILYLDFFLKVYEHFHTEKYTTNEEELNLQLSHTGLMGEYIFNPDHSIRSIYNLDRKQLISNGSFLIGGGVFYSSVYSKDDALYGYSNKENVYYVGPNAGYSYTWILNNVFLLIY